MWYFAWILGIGLACGFSILNAIWLEIHFDNEKLKEFVQNER